MATERCCTKQRWLGRHHRHAARGGWERGQAGLASLGHLRTGTRNTNTQILQQHQVEDYKLDFSKYQISNIQ